MSVAAKTPLIKIEVSQGKKRKLYLVSAADAAAVEVILGRLNDRSSDEDYVDAEVLSPHLKDPIKGPATSFHGIRLRHGLTQKQMAEKIGVSQSDVSKMEKGERPIGKKIAMRIGEALGIDYRRFL
jgi:DNA-binding XRE family transcriptional regulator